MWLYTGMCWYLHNRAQVWKYSPGRRLVRVVIQQPHPEFDFYGAAVPSSCVSWPGIYARMLCHTATGDCVHKSLLAKTRIVVFLLADTFFQFAPALVCGRTLWLGSDQQSGASSGDWLSIP